MQSMVISKKQWFLIGVTTGVILSLFVMPLIEDCHQLRQSMADYNSHNWYSMIANNDYNPVLRLNRSQTHFETKHINRRLFRPKYFSTELEVKDNLLVCVHLSANANQVLNSSSNLLNQTIEDFSDKVMLFSEEPAVSSASIYYRSDESVVVLTAKSPEVPFVRPNPKYLNILNYLFAKRIVRNYNFVFIISDKTFVNRNNLYKFLTNFSVSQHVFSSPIISNNDINYELDSNPKDRLESGVLFSASLLLKCNLDQNCLNRFRNKYPNPTQNTFISYELKSNSEQINENILNSQLLYNSLTVYPVNHINTYLKLHLILCQKSINESISKLETIENQIITSNDNESELEWPLGVERSLKPTNRFEVIRWTYYNESHSLMPNDFDVTLPINRIESIELSEVKSQCIEWLQNKYQNLINDQNLQIINFYKKLDAFRGLEYVVDFRLRAFADIKRLHVIKSFNKIELIPNVPYVTESVRIVFILTIKSVDEIESTSSFFTQYTNICLKKSSHRTVLILVLIYKSNDEKDEYIGIKEEATQLQTKYKNSGAKIAWIPIISAKESRVPTELAYLDILVKKMSKSFSDALLLQCRPNMILSLDFLNRVRLNTIQSNQVFFPIPFIEYRLRSQVKPLKNFDVRKDNGYFESTNFNHFSFYLSDYLKARQVSQHLLPIVRNEQFLKRSVYYSSDIDVYHLFVNYNKQIDTKANKSNQKLFIMRAIEPELKLKHQNFGYDCLSYESNRYSIENCEKRALFGLGTRPQLAALVIDDNKKDGLEVNDEESANSF